MHQGLFNGIIFHIAGAIEDVDAHVCGLLPGY
jgi:hypothetical protein